MTVYFTILASAVTGGLPRNTLNQEPSSGIWIMNTVMYSDSTTLKKIGFSVRCVKD